MAKKFVYQKSTSRSADFVYIDLLPKVKRARQFNVNVVVTLLIAIVLGYFLIYIPYSNKTFEYEAINGLNNDLKYQLILTNEEFEGNEINLEAINLQEDIATLENVQVDLNNLIDDLEILINNSDGDIKSITYNLSSETITLDVANQNQFVFNNLNTEILNIKWVNSSTHTIATREGSNTFYQSTFEIGVDFNVE
ncbi:MAG: hypothetical protein K9L74_00665 [Candidatus Izimaplasma sp.]|nr:hypothetical protein [Candidatus Izimaplasma bacterium]